MLPVHPAYIKSVTPGLRDVYRKLSPEGDPYKFAQMLYRLVVSAEEGKRIPLFLPTGEDALKKFHDTVKKMNKVLVDATPWSADLKKDVNDGKAKARL